MCDACEQLCCDKDVSEHCGCNGCVFEECWSYCENCLGLGHTADECEELISGDNGDTP